MQATFSIIKLFFFGIWSFISIVFGAILYLFQVKNGMSWIAKYFWSPVVLPLLQANVKIEGLSNVSPDGNYLIMANHNSFIDIPILFKAMPFYTYFIAKKELKKIPLLGWYIKAYGMIFIDRSDRIKSRASIAKAGSLIENGKRVIIFPEGTKSKDGQIAAFKKGGFHLAQQTKAPILPVKIEGARNVWPNKQPLKLKRGEIHVKIGKPIQHETINQMDISEASEHVRSVLLKL